MGRYAFTCISKAHRHDVPYQKSNDEYAEKFEQNGGASFKRSKFNIMRMYVGKKDG